MSDKVYIPAEWKSGKLVVGDTTLAHYVVGAIPAERLERLLKAARTMHSAHDQWLSTGVATPPDRSKAIFEAMQAALEEWEGK